MSEVVPIGSAFGSYLGSMSFYRMPDGEIRVTLDHMPVAIIEAEPTITARFWRAADWCLRGSLDLMRQACRFDDETRESMANDNSEARP